MKTFSRAIGALALVASATLLLSGCSAAGPTYKLSELRAIASSASTPEGYKVASPIPGTTGASDDYQKATNLYKAASVKPAACAQVAAVEGLTSASDFKNGVSDKIQELTRYEATSNTSVYESLLVRGRIFKDADSASKFLVAVSKAAGACSNGYSVFAASTASGSTPAFKVDGVATTSIENLPSGLDGNSIIETSSDGSTDPSFRISYIQRGNAIIAITAGIKASGNINFSDANELVAQIAKKFAANASARG